MTSKAFKARWTRADKALSPFTPSRLERFNFTKQTADFLTIAGLPSYCEPNLSFSNDTDIIGYGINNLTEQYDFDNDKGDFEQYVVIGRCREGDVIAVDTKNNDRIVELDHEDLFSARYFNSSILTLAHFLLIYRDFETDVMLQGNNSGHKSIYNFTDKQFSKLKEKMLAVDGDAVLHDGFWKDELEIMLSIREDELSGPV